MELFIISKYYTFTTAGIISVIIGTNLHETIEFITMYFSWSYLIFIFVLALIIYLLNYISRKVKLNNKLVILFLPYFCLYSLFYVIIPGKNLTECLSFTRLIAPVEQAVEDAIAFREIYTNMQNNVQIVDKGRDIPNIVFILGESTNRNHMHLYGYYLPNTPNLDALNEKGEISVFRDVVSPHSTTIAVLSKLFTFCNRESDQEWYHYNNLIDVMNAAGYKTHWLSNQETSGVWGNVAQIYAAHSDVSAFTRIRDSREDYGIVDGELFPLIDDAIANRSEDKNFYVVHLMGGHGLYYNRFPYSFSKFSKDDINLPITDGKKEIVAQYDNALYYNDYIVSSIIDKFRDSETLVIYVPDHGEAVYDEGEDMSGHIEEILHII